MSMHVLAYNLTRVMNIVGTNRSSPRSGLAERVCCAPCDRSGRAACSRLRLIDSRLVRKYLRRSRSHLDTPSSCILVVEKKAPFSSTAWVKTEDAHDSDVFRAFGDVYHQASEEGLAMVDHTIGMLDVARRRYTKRLGTQGSITTKWSRSCPSSSPEPGRMYLACLGTGVVALFARQACEMCGWPAKMMGLSSVSIPRS